jgi:hypothetical protein
VFSLVSRPDLKQDHLLIGRKETPLTPRRDKPLAPINTTNSSRPSLSRSSSTTTSSSPSSARGHHHNLSRGLPPPRNETEAVIEALFNPTIFSAPLVSTPYSLTPSKLTPGSLDTPRADEPFTPRPRDSHKKGPRLSSVVDEEKRELSSDSEDELPGGDGARSRPRTKASTASRQSDSPESRRHPSGNKTALDIAMDINYRMDKDKTIRPKLPSGDQSNSNSWEMINYPDGSKGIKRKHNPLRSATADSTTSTRTDFSTTSSRAPPTRTSSDGRSMSSPNASSPASGAVSRDGSGPSAAVIGMPTISIIAETPTTATQDQSRWYKPFRRATGQTTTSSKKSRSPSRSRDGSLDLGHDAVIVGTSTPAKPELATGA